jgi:L-serine deaminase
MFSVFELFKIGIGPSSSHTVGPMKAAAAFADGLAATGAIDRIASVEVALLGSLAFTGKGHATDKAVILGLSGQRPDSVEPDAAEALAAEVRAIRRKVFGWRGAGVTVSKTIAVAGSKAIERRPASSRRFVARTSAASASAASGSTLSGR